MAKKNAVSEYLSKIGKRGGQVKVPKGVAALSSEERKQRASQAAKARWDKVREEEKATKKAKKK